MVDQERADRAIEAGVAENFSDAARRGLALLALVVERTGTSLAIRP